MTTETHFPGAIPSIFREPDMAVRVEMIADSFARLLGKPLVEPGGDLLQAMWAASQVILAHGMEDDPVLFFGNAAALRAFETDIESLVAMPSRLTAEAPLREERQALLDRVTTNGFIDDYSGVRISAKGRRFTIDQAVVWNIVDGRGVRRGQAAAFRL